MVAVVAAAAVVVAEVAPGTVAVAVAVVEVAVAPGTAAAAAYDSGRCRRLSPRTRGKTLNYQRYYSHISRKT